MKNTWTDAEHFIITESLELSEDCYLPSMSKREHLVESVRECLTIGLAHKYREVNHFELISKLTLLSEKDAAKLVAEARLPREPEPELMPTPHPGATSQ